jgi:hypothetical protein
MQFAVFCAVVVSLTWGTRAVVAESPTAVEFFHGAYGHYFVTTSAAEIAGLDDGAPSGWTRTGETLRVLAPGAAGAANVCRFWSGSTYAPKSSHFYTPFD